MPYDFKCIKIFLNSSYFDKAMTQETVGGPNGAQRSEFRRTAPPDNIRCRDWPMINWHVIYFRGWPHDMATRGIYNHPAVTNSGRRDDATAIPVIH